MLGLGATKAYAPSAANPQVETARPGRPESLGRSGTRIRGDLSGWMPPAGQRMRLLPPMAERRTWKAAEASRPTCPVLAYSMHRPPDPRVELRCGPDSLVVQYVCVPGGGEMRGRAVPFFLFGPEMTWWGGFWAPLLVSCSGGAPIFLSGFKKTRWLLRNRAAGQILIFWGRHSIIVVARRRRGSVFSGRFLAHSHTPSTCWCRERSLV